MDKFSVLLDHGNYLTKNRFFNKQIIGIHHSRISGEYGSNHIFLKTIYC